MNSIALLTNTLATFISIYTYVLIIRILLTWFPNISWYNQPFSTLSQLTLTSTCSAQSFRHWVVLISLAIFLLQLLQVVSSVGCQQRLYRPTL